MEIKIYGASDDLVEVEGCEGADEFNTYEGGKVMWRGDLFAPNGEQMRAYALYDGCWHVAVGQVDERVPFPSWPVRHEQSDVVKYSTAVVIDAPDGTVLENVWPTE